MKYLNPNFSVLQVRNWDFYMPFKQKRLDFMKLIHLLPFIRSEKITNDYNSGAIKCLI